MWTKSTVTNATGGHRFFEHVPVVESLYLVFTWMPDELPQATQVFVVALGLGISNAI